MRKNILFFILFLTAATVWGQSYTMPSSGSQTITACSGVLLDPGGTEDYPSSCESYIIIQPSVPGCKVKLTGTYHTESSYDQIRVYNGTTTAGTQLGNFSGTGTCNVTSTSGPLLVRFTSDFSVQNDGFQFNISCAGGCMCASPDVTATSGNQTVTLSWGASQYTNGYILEYGPHGFTVGQGTQVYTGSTSYTVNNLNNGAEYDFYVWYDCGNDHQVTDEIPTMVSATPNNIHIMTGSNATITGCNTVIYDNGGPTGNYSNYSNNVLHIHPATSGCKVVLTGTYNTENSYDYIRVYNGNSTTGTPIAEFTGSGSINPPIISTASTGYLTVRFHSDGSTTKSGFVLNEFCICEIDTTCVGTPYQLHGFDTTFSTSGLHILSRTDQDGTPIVVGVLVQTKVPVSISGAQYFCGEDTITLTASNAVSYFWSTGATTPSIDVQELGTYRVTVTDNRGCIGTASHKISPISEFIQAINFPLMCAGDDYPITGSYNAGSEIEMFHLQSTLSMADTAFLPDGVPCSPYGCSYRSNLTFTDYNDGDVVESADDIYYVKISLEHSYIGDLYINITCPNGQKADIMRWSGNGFTQCSNLIPQSSRDWQPGNNSESAYFGVAYDYEAANSCDRNAPANAPGTPWNYCWSNNTTQGYTYAASAGSLVYRTANVHGGTVDSSNVAAGTQFYHPDESFESLIGCPLNGAWYIEVMDGWGSDNGYLFGWELALTDEYATNVGFDVASIVPEAPWTTTTSDTTFIMSPPASLENDTVVNCILHFYDSDGCIFDSIVPVQVYATYNEDTTVTVCDSYVWRSVNYTQSGDFTVHNPSPVGCDSIFSLHLTVNNSAVNDTVATECGSFEWHGVEYTATPAMAPTYNYHTACGCDSVVTLHLTINQPTDTTMNVTVFQNELPYVLNGVSYTTEGEYTQMLTNVSGCDSLCTLNLSVLYNVTSEVDSSVCVYALPLVWNGQTFTGAGVKTATLVSAVGVDSVVTMNLHVYEPLHPHISGPATSCDGSTEELMSDAAATYLWSTGATTQAIQVTASDTYTVTVTDEHGCHFDTAFSIAFYAPDYLEIDTTACDHFIWEDVEYAASGEYELQYTNAHGCDSVVLLKLQFGTMTEVSYEDVVCEGDGYHKYGFNISALETIGEDTLRRTLNLHSVLGCDSVLHITLSVVDTAMRLLSLTPDFCEEMSAELLVESAMPNFLWSTGEQTPNITVTHSGLYSVTASQEHCERTEHLVIEACEFPLILPNAITPSNVDGLNDYFAFPEDALQGISLFEVSIFDRWGEMVFYSRDKSFRWNGEVGGRIPVGTVFTYLIRYTDTSGRPFELRGTLTVL